MHYQWRSWRNWTGNNIFVSFLFTFTKQNLNTKKKRKALRRSISLYVSCALQVAHIRALAGLQELVHFKFARGWKTPQVELNFRTNDIVWARPANKGLICMSPNTGAKIELLICEPKGTFYGIRPETDVRLDQSSQARMKKNVSTCVFWRLGSIEHPNDDEAIIIYKNMVWVATQHGLWKKSW